MAIIADTAESFPSKISYGFISSPYYETSVVRREGGFERVNRKWDRPLIFLQAVPMETLTRTDYEDLRDFYHAMGGPSTYFRVRDWADYKTTQLDLMTGFVEMPLIEIGTTGTYQLVRQYVASGGTTQNREIVKPIGSTIRVGNDSAVEQDVANWDLDEATGILTPLGGFAGTPSTWGGEYDIEARFNSNLDIDIVNYGIRSARVSMLERRRAQNT